MSGLQKNISAAIYYDKIYGWLETVRFKKYADPPGFIKYDYAVV